MINLELKKGMYVRTPFGMKKIYEINNKATKWKYLYKLKNQDGDGCIDLGQLCDDDIIGEPSFDLIDLIEVGDYVNGYKVLFIDVFFSEGKNVKCINNEEERVCFYEEDIKDIITKEQFNSMKYVVERDK